MIGNLLAKQDGEKMNNELEVHYEKGLRKVVLDLKRIINMSSSGLNVLINILTKSRSKGGKVIVVNVPEKIKNLFILTKLTGVLNIEENLEQAQYKLNQ